MKLKYTVLFFLSIVSTSIYAQSIAPQSVNSGGTKMTQANGSLSFTVGELVVLSQTDSEGNSLGSGFTSGATISTATIQEPDAELLNVNVFPNPTTDLITVSIQDTKLSDLIIEVTDLNGKIVSSGKYAGISNNIGINTSSWERGTYFLNLKDNQTQIIGSYKIIKY
jgi:hypothetical protein